MGLNFLIFNKDRIFFRVYLKKVCLPLLNANLKIVVVNFQQLIFVLKLIPCPLYTRGFGTNRETDAL